jgi:hypothetical protein
MFDEVVLGSEFFEGLARADAQIAASARASRCPHCGGPLHVSNYGRKPRGGLVAVAGESQVVRFSLCCGQEGCRRRATPPSIRFLGRRVYLEAVVIVASVLGLVERVSKREPIAGVPSRTVGRWLGWWSGPFVKTAVFAALRARLVTSITPTLLPRVVLEHMRGSADERLERLSLLLRPLTTASWVGDHDW